MHGLQGSRLRAARATARLQELVSEAGPCGELTVMRVPLPLDPGVLLDGECAQSCDLPLLNITYITVGVRNRTVWMNRHARAPALRPWRAA